MYSFENPPPVLGGIIADLRLKSRQRGMKKSAVAEVIWKKTAILYGANGFLQKIAAIIHFLIRNFILIEDEEERLWVDVGRATEVLVLIRKGRKMRRSATRSGRDWGVEENEVAPPGQWLKDIQDIAAGRDSSDPIINRTHLQRTGTP